jgi:methanogen homocitrate synthase
MNVNYHEENRWWVSPFNLTADVRKTYQLPPRVQLHDATLRDGEQTPGVVFSVADKVAIAEKLAEVGVDRIEAGMPAVSEQDFQAIKEITKLNLPSKIFTFARAMRADIDKALECGAYGVVVEVPIGYPKLQWQFKWTWEDVLRKSADVVNYAKQRGLYVLYFPYDTTRAREEDLTNLLTRAGAEVIHCCANGLGERTGNAALEELITCLHVLYGYETHYKLDKLPELGELVRRLSGLPIAVNKPILGSRNFTRESGIGVDLVVKEPLAMFGTHPALTGRSGDIVLGKKSGKASITYTLEQMGLTADDDAVAEMLKMVKDKSIAKRGLVTNEEFREIADKVLSSVKNPA